MMIPQPFGPYRAPPDGKRTETGAKVTTSKPHKIRAARFQVGQTRDDGVTVAGDRPAAVTKNIRA
jgi:hypothetical protein